MVIHYQPGRLRRNSDQPTAITNVLVATSGSSWRTSEIPLGTPTCSARTRLPESQPSGATSVWVCHAYRAQSPEWTWLSAADAETHRAHGDRVTNEPQYAHVNGEPCR